MRSLAIRLPLTPLLLAALIAAASPSQGQGVELGTCQLVDANGNPAKECWCVPTTAGGKPDRGGTCPRPSPNLKRNIIGINKDRFGSHEYSCLQSEKYSLGTCNPFEEDCPAPRGHDNTKAVCGVSYATMPFMPKKKRLQKRKGCKGRRYGLRTYDSMMAANADKATVTHMGHCGACSPLQDLSFYMDQPNASVEIAACAGEFVKGPEALQACFSGLGLSEDCAALWANSIGHVALSCLSDCAPVVADPDSLRFDKTTCEPNACIKCQSAATMEAMRKFGGRTLTNSHLHAAIGEPCEDLKKSKNVRQDPCGWKFKVKRRRRKTKNVERPVPLDCSSVTAVEGRTAADIFDHKS